ncbi:MAG: hypothetical protein RLZ28_346 [Actinomycetota bacterium]|jgi:outer membrane protein OmpA-like peptidoglycan-associated protein
MKKLLSFAVALGVVFSGLVASTPAMATGAPDYVIDCQATQGAPWVDTDPSSSYQGSLDVYLDGAQEYTKTVEVKNCGYHLATDGVNNAGVYVGTSADVTYTIVIPVNTFKEARGYNTWDVPNLTTFIVNFWNFPPTKTATADKSSIGQGESVTFATSNTDPTTLYALFVDGTLSKTGAVSTIDSVVSWATFGGCSSLDVELRVYDATYTGSETVTYQDSYASSALVTFDAGTGGDCIPTLVADKSSISEGESVTFTPSGASSSALIGLFLDGILVETGPLGFLGSSPIPWEALGNCTSHVVILRIYNVEATPGAVVSLSDPYAATVSVTFNAGTSADCPPTVTPTVTKSTIAKTFIGFAVNSAKLTKKMKAGIKAFIKARAGITSIDITGFTMGPIMKVDRQMATSRATAVKAYVKSLLSSVKVVTHAKTDKRIGAKYRRAIIVLKYETAG